MLDPDIKKLLQDLKMDDLVGEIEGNKEANPEPAPAPFLPPTPEPIPAKPLEVKTTPANKTLVCQVPNQENFYSGSEEILDTVGRVEGAGCLHTEVRPNTAEEAKRSRKNISGWALVLVAVTLLPATYMFWHAPALNISSENIIAYNDDDPDKEEEENLQNVRAETAASWAKEIVSLDPQTGKSVHLLWDILRRRKEDLEEVANQLSSLLADNALFRQDFYGQNASVLLSRYQAIDARYSVDIANQIDAIYDQIKEGNKPELTRAYAEMLGELGAESYTTHNIQIVKEIFAQEALCEKALLTVEASKSLGELEQNVRHADSLIKSLQNNGIMQTFRQGQEYLGLVALSCKETLDRLLVQINISEDGLAVLERILVDIHASQAEIQKYRQQFDKALKPRAKTLL